MHTCSRQESNFIMETFYLLLLLNNPQLGLSSLSPHLVHICSEEIKRPPLEGGEEASYLPAHSLTQSTKNPWLCLRFTFTTGWFFFSPNFTRKLINITFPSDPLRDLRHGRCFSTEQSPSTLLLTSLGGRCACGSLPSSTAFCLDLYLSI